MTTVWDHYYFGQAVAHAVCDVGLTGVIAPTLQDIGGPFVGRVEEEWATTMLLSTGETGKQWHQKGIVASFGPHATDTVSKELWQRIAAAQTQHGLPLHGHLAQTVDEVVRCQQRHGMTPVGWLDSMGVLATPAAKLWAHAIYMTDADLDTVMQTSSTLVFCPFSQIQFATPAEVVEWKKRGIPWALATDCAASNDSMNLQGEGRWLSTLSAMEPSVRQLQQNYRQSGDVQHLSDLQGLRKQHVLDHTVSSDALLDAMWTTPGKLHSQLPVGQIAEGSLANFAIWNSEHPQCLAKCQPGSFVQW